MSQGTVYIRNSDTNDLFVTIIDRNASPGGTKIWDNDPLNEDQTLPVMCQINGDGEARLDWKAIDTQNAEETASGTERVDEGSEFTVYAR